MHNSSQITIGKVLLKELLGEVILHITPLCSLLHTLLKDKCMFYRTSETSSCRTSAIFKYFCPLAWVLNYQLSTHGFLCSDWAVAQAELSHCTHSMGVPRGAHGVWNPISKSQKLWGSLAILIRIPPSQHSMVGHYRHASQTPLKWCFAGGLMMAHL